ncbi:MAG: 4-(cytidine 5'-diphospho)-2-C-methyl-D-erythritol kinase [Nanoarchaeota archaeon]|nr:4-(cytidine 5'-diphospho)-2-C-methyl-D-erythritol kinase [Nanoarchaeota archaeon]
MKLKSHAKINLTLEIIGKLPDCYHRISSIVQEIELHDILYFKKSREIKLYSKANMPLDSNNLIWKAAEKMIENYDTQGIEVIIKKNIPIAAGLGGGSSNATTTLKAMNKIYGLKLTNKELEKISVQIGMDSPFFLYGGTALAAHKGEQIKPIKRLPKTDLILIKPDYEISTKKMYQNYKLKKEISKTKLMLKNITDLGKVKKNLYNSFEESLIQIYPEIKHIKQALAEENIFSLVSGSGSTIFAFADKIPESLKNYQTWQTKTR